MQTPLESTPRTRFGEGDTSSRPIAADVVVVGPSLDSHGGITSVNRTLSDAGFFADSRDGLLVELRPSTRDGTTLAKTTFALRHIARFAIARRTRSWLLHAHMAFQASFWRKSAYGWIARRRGGRVIYHIHPCAFWDFYVHGGWLRRLAIRATLARADAVIVLTGHMKEKIRRIAPHVPLFVVPNPIDLGRAPSPVPREPATIVFLGWLVPNKGVFELVDAISRVRERIPEVKAVFAGSKDDGTLRKHVARSGLTDAISFPGWLSPEAVAALLARATVLALPSYSEGVPMSILEALACGTPIVATSVGGIPEILTNERNALLIRPRDVEALNQALLRLLSDGELRARMSIANRDAARSFEVGAVAASLRGIYRSILFADRATI